MVGYDFFPTFCEWAGVTQALPKEIEGGTITALLRGEQAPVKRPREELVFHFPHYQGDTPHTALLLGDYKLLRFYEDHSLQLYDLSRDIRESHDLAGSMPEKVEELEARMDTYLAEVHAQFPTPNPDFDPANPPSLSNKKPGKGDKGGGGKMGGKGDKGGKGGKGGMKGRVRPENQPRESEEKAETPSLPMPVALEPQPPSSPQSGRDERGGPRSPILAAIDTDGDREISTAEMREAGKTLLALDTNQSGQLESTEIAALATATGPVTPSASGPPPLEVTETPLNWLAAHADELDLNGDGGIGRTELMNQGRMAFNAFDGDENGVLKPDEYTGHQPKAPVAAYLTANISTIDTDGNTWLTAAEFAAVLGRDFTEADTNGDNLVSASERVPSLRDLNPAPVSGSFPTAKAVVATAKSGAPNFVVFLIDDMGWNDMGFSGNSVIETPRTDEMARRGMIFTNAYASAPNCAPTRACLMSGQYTPRHGVFTVVDARHSPGLPHHKVLAAESRADLVTESVTIAEAMRAGGYATGMFGMWNLGAGKDGPTTPTGPGFDVFKQPRDVGFEKDRYFNEKGEYLTDALTREGITWINENRDKPFFLYMAYHAVHSPFEPKPELVEKYRNKGATDPDYAATVEAVDTNVGRIVDALAESGLSENTVVIFQLRQRRHTPVHRSARGRQRNPV